MNEESTLGGLFQTHRKNGSVTWIGIRPERRQPLKPLEAVHAEPDSGLFGDHYSGRPGSARQVTLIQAEHLDAVASILGHADVLPEQLRRNIVVEGINLQALKDHRFSVGNAVLEYSGACHPCSRMEENLGDGGYNAMRGHGGITARVIRSGEIRLGDAVIMISKTASAPGNDS